MAVMLTAVFYRLRPCFRARVLFPSLFHPLVYLSVLLLGSFPFAFRFLPLYLLVLCHLS